MLKEIVIKQNGTSLFLRDRDEPTLELKWQDHKYGYAQAYVWIDRESIPALISALQELTKNNSEDV